MRGASYNKGMANYVTDEAICLRVTDFSETSQIVVLFTAGHGIVPVIAKGSKRVSKKGASGTVSGPLDLLTGGEAVFVPAKGTAELGTLAGWELTNHRTGLRRSLAGLNGGMMCAEMTLGLLRPQDPHAELCGELEAALELMGGAQRARGLVAYAKTALVAAGYRPELGACVGCGKAVGAEEVVRFSTWAGGVVCGGCRAQGETVEVAGRIVLALERLVGPRALLAALPERAAEAGALKIALGLLVGQMEAVMGRGLKTKGVVGGIFEGIG